MKQLPEDEVQKAPVSRTEKIARVGVIVMLIGLFAALFLYGLGECERYYQPYNDRHVSGERKPNP